MGYLADYKHDVFISYAHGDQISPWSQALCAVLTATLNDVLERKGANGVNVWMDDKLEGNVGLTEQLKERVEDSAVIVIIMSTFYLDSPWCAQEASWFADICKRRTDGANRLFVVRYRECNEQRWPSFLKDSRGHAVDGYRFYDRDRNAEANDFPFGYPVPDKADAVSQSSYYKVIQKLAAEIKDRLQQIANAPPPEPVVTVAATANGSGRIWNDVAAAAAAPAPKGPTVFLAVGTEDVEEERQQVRAKLTEAGFDVIPPAADQTGASAKQTLSPPPTNCSHAVFVLGGLPGRSMPIDGEDLVAWQYAQAKASGLNIAAWLPPHLTVAGLRDPKYRSLVEQLQLVAAPDAAAFAATLPQPPREAAGPGRLVFLDRPDATAAEAVQVDMKMRAILRDLKVTVLPMNRASLPGRDLATVERTRQELRQKRVKCDRIMLLLENPNFMPEDWWIDIQSDVVPKAKPTLRCAVLDAVGSDLVSSDEITVFNYGSPSLRDEIQAWLTL